MPLAQNNLHTTEAHLGVTHSEPLKYTFSKGTQFTDDKIQTEVKKQVIKLSCYVLIKIEIET